MKLTQIFVRPASVIGAAVLLLGLTGSAALAVADPWSPDPVGNELFEQSSQGWMVTVPLGMSESSSMTITAKQDLVLRSANTYSNSVDFSWRLTGTCPVGFSSVRMVTGDTCTVTWTASPTTLSSTAAGWSFYATPAAGGEAVLGQHNFQFGTRVFTVDDVDFGSTPVGTSVTKPVTFRNVSAVDALLSLDNLGYGFTVLGRPADPVLVPAGGELTYDVVFTPPAVGDLRTGAWWRTTVPGLEGRSTEIVRFTGTGTYGDVVLDVPDVNFDEVALGESASREVTVTNTGTADADVFVANADELAAVGVAVELAGDTRLAPGDAIEARLTWTPKDESQELVESLVMSYTAETDSQTGAGVPIVPVAALLSGHTPEAVVVDPTDPTDPATPVVPVDPEQPTVPEQPTSPSATPTVTAPAVTPPAGSSEPSAQEQVSDVAGAGGAMANAPAGGLASTGAQVAVVVAVALVLVAVGAGAVWVRRRSRS